MKYITIYGVQCYEIKKLTQPSKDNLIRIEYKVKHGSKLYRAWVFLGDFILTDQITD